LVTRVVPDEELDAEVLKVAQQIAAGASKVTSCDQTVDVERFGARF